MININMYEVYENWRSGLGKFKWSLVSTPFASSKHIVKDLILDDDLKKKTIDDILDDFSKDLIVNQKEDEIIIFDFDGERSLDLAFNLNKEYMINPILIFAHIFHSNGIVGSKDMLNKLIKYSYGLKNENSKYGIFLDYDRFSDREYNPREYFNNQYRLTEEEMPYIEDFIRAGIDKVIVISKAPIKIDIKEYIDYIKSSELKLEVHLIE
ncbi:hypothetical protein [Clostridium intestinale]|uniref:Uncharacterized protein n=1 Tax=Clostridium intestinale DSM 6191 TaxID=1121320 RepID=A0A1M5XLW2_9CLOT|nr:hypothetical protein [Clostridium intestinale]SHI00243.1 hypothetical protein SAMN02745941_01480 [Clostridium intestinale DSM 6191]